MFVWIADALFWRILLSLAFILYINRGTAAEYYKVCEPKSGVIDIGTRGSREKSYCIGCQKLWNCTTVLGSVDLKGISFRNDKELVRQIRFPLLKEITGHLIVTFLEDVRSLSDILPNLAVIRGRVANLFKDYAFVVYRNNGLRTLGLNSLTVVKQGGIKIEFNPFLCYLERIRWKSLMNHGKYELSFGGNSKDCFDKCSGCRTPSGHGSSGVSYCWGGEKKNCQRLCNAVCGSKGCIHGSEGNCCPQECLGGCTKVDSNIYCNACQHVRLQSGECAKTCPAGLKEVNEFSCSDKCPQGTFHYLEKCVKDCPAGYTKNETKRTCDKCADDKCPRECRPPGQFEDTFRINLLSDSVKLKGCTVIRANLEIEIRKVPGGTNIAHVLTEDLGNIEKVRGYVVVRQSSSLISLNFLRKLKTIEPSGRSLFSKRYALVIFDNPNLESLWDFDPDFNIVRGGVFIQLNPRLCLYNLYPLVDDALQWTRNDTRAIISETTNGNARSCDVHHVNITVKAVKVKWCKDLCVRVSWPNKITDHRNVLLYSIWYRETDSENIDEYDDVDACNSDHVWNRKDSQKTRVNADKLLSEYVGSLSAFTLYAFRVEAFVIDGKGVKSAIAYFRTKETIPSPPLAVQVNFLSSDSLQVGWKKPFFPNGVITHYFLRYKESDSSYRWKKDIDWCNNHDSITLSNKNKDRITDNGQTDGNSCAANVTCDCEKENRRELGPEAKEALFAKEFQDIILSKVFSKKDNNDDARKVTAKTTAPTAASPVNITTSAPDCGNNSSCTSSGKPISDSTATGSNEVTSTVLPTTQPFPEIQINTTNETFIIPKLKYFTEYKIQVCACNSAGCGVNKKFLTQCSEAVGRTDKNVTADDVGNSLSVRVNNFTRKFILTWRAPEKPNGAVLRYDAWIYSGNRTGKIVCISAPNTKHGDTAPLGRHSAQVRAITVVGNGSWSNVVTFVIAENLRIPAPRPGTDNRKLATIVGVSLAGGFFIMCFVSLFLFVYMRKRYRKAKQTGVIYASVNPEYMNCSDVYVADEWEVPREKIKLIKELGNGSFGMVYQGEAKDLLPGEQCCNVAVKTVSDNGSIRDKVEFLKEASIMKAFNCNHVVRLLGVVSAGHPVLVVMELMENGDLKTFLRRRRPEEPEEPALPPPTYLQLYQMVAEIADGMAYLADRKFVHRDLAARNCMVSSNCTCKIGDFGMARDVYETDYYRKGGKGFLPVRWMPPESLKDGVFTCASDVWSFGVVLWEMATLAQQPYQGKSNEEVMNYVINGEIMDVPDGCTEIMSKIMLQCWQYKPKVRPSFTSIVSTFEEYVSQSFVDRSFYHNQREREDTESTIQSTMTEKESLPDEVFDNSPAETVEESTHDDETRESEV